MTVPEDQAPDTAADPTSTGLPGPGPELSGGPAAGPGPVPSGPATYEERWTAPLRVWLAVLTVTLVAAATIHAGADGLRAVVPYVVLPLLALAFLARESRGRVRVVDGVLSVPGARIPLEQLGGVRELDLEGTRRVRGPLAQPRAFVATRAWLTCSVQVQVEDPDDDTPYWLVGTRTPDRLAAALRDRSSSAPGS